MRTESLETKGGNWRAAIRKLKEQKLAELRDDREMCQTVTVRGKRYRLAACSIWDLEKLAQMKAEDAVKRSIQKAAA